MQKGIGGAILNSIYSYSTEIECGGKMRNEIRVYLRFRRIVHVGFYLLDASRA